MVVDPDQVLVDVNGGRQAHEDHRAEGHVLHGHGQAFVLATLGHFLGPFAKVAEVVGLGRSHRRSGSIGSDANNRSEQSSLQAVTQ